MRLITPIPAMVETDATRLKQILLNVIGNAIKFTDKGKIEVPVAHRPVSKQLSICGCDSGVGLDDSQAGRIFSPFTQADASHTRRYGGTGLGLSLSRKLARNLGGDVILRTSEPGVGSEFEVLIGTGDIKEATMFYNVNDFKEVSPVTLTPAEPIIDGPLKGVRVLLVEDSPNNRQLLSLFLRKAGAEFTIAIDGKEALEKGLKSSSELILMDVQMRILNGYEVTIRLRKACARRPIFALTAHAQAEERTQSFPAGCNEHVAKPVNFQKLIALIARYTHASH